jgi:tRNA(Leu) C34 or U34 (ribose-2'-O)-methylase TrmL
VSDIAISDRFAARTGRGYAAVGLVQPKTPSNVGSVLRAAGCYEVDLVAVEGERGARTTGFITSNATDTMKAWRHIPTILTDDLFSIVPVGCVPVAVDLMPNARSLVDFVHPQAAFYIFGPEDGTLGERHAKLGMARVFVPTSRCMNLAATVNVVLYDRLAKATRAAQAQKAAA